MSRQHSRSPHYRRFPWEEPGFDPYKVVAELDGEQMDSRHHHHHHHHNPRGDPEERWSYAGDDMHSEGQRRSPTYRDDRQYRHQRHQNQEEFHQRRSSPHHDTTGYDNRRPSPLRDGGADGERRIGGFREAYPNYDDRGKSSNSPPRLKRERLPPTPRSNQDYQERESGTGWRREGQGRGRGRFRDVSPGGGSDDQRGGADRERGRRNTQGPNRDKQWEDSYQQRNQHFKRQRREMEDTDHAGFRNEEHFGEQRYQVGSPRNRFQGEQQGGLSRGDNRLSGGPVVIEHDHGIPDRRETSQWGNFNKRRDRDSDFDRQRGPRPSSSSQERFRTSESRSEDQEDSRPRHFQDDWRNSSYHENRRTPEERPSLMSLGSQDSPMAHRGRGGFRSSRGRVNRGQYGKSGPARNQPHSHQSSQGYQDYPEGKSRPGFQPTREVYEDPDEAEPSWAEEDRLPEWKQGRPGSLDRNSPVVDLDPKMPRQRLREWNDQKSSNLAAETEETLTIKVDMSQPVHKNSQLCYSSDRQLSLDLVNVGRQRLDFLPMLEHSGTYRETAMHTGTFAQEIITLVHSVKEQYFRSDGLTLNERFSAPQKGGYQEEEETEELTLDQRFSSNRGFSLKMNSLLDDEEPLFTRLGPLPPTRGPGDLRHDLEKRRQERLEGVKVTILGNSLPQRPQGQRVSELDLEYGDRDDSAQMDDEEFWTEEPSRRREGNMGQRRGAPYRQNMGPQRRNNRFGNRLGPMRRQNFRNNSAGPGW